MNNGLTDNFDPLLVSLRCWRVAYIHGIFHKSVLNFLVKKAFFDFFFYTFRGQYVYYDTRTRHTTWTLHGDTDNNLEK
jgi:hypothetical protein